jgi:hypothetical protein
MKSLGKYLAGGVMLLSPIVVMVSLILGLTGEIGEGLALTIAGIGILAGFLAGEMVYRAESGSQD